MKYVTSIVIVLLSVGMYFLYISPTLAEIKVLMVKKTEYENTLTASKELKSKRDALLLAYNAIPEADIARLNKIVPATFDTVLFANNANALAVKNGLSIKQFTVGKQDADSRGAANTAVATEPAPTNSPYKTFTVNMDVSGSYENFTRFLADVESSLELMDVDTLSVTSASRQTNGPATLQFSIGIKTYALK